MACFSSSCSFSDFSLKSCWSGNRSTKLRTGRTGRGPHPGPSPDPDPDLGPEASRSVAMAAGVAQSRRDTTAATNPTTETSSVATSRRTAEASRSTFQRSDARGRKSHPPCNAKIGGPRLSDVAHDQGHRRGVAQRDDPRHARALNASCR